MPDKRDLHVDALLTGLAVEYSNQPSEYIADKAMPVVPVVKESDKYATFNKDNRIRVPQALRAPKTESKEVDWGVGTASYGVEEYALHVLISDRERENADPPFNLDLDGTQVVTDLLMNAKEDRVATLLTTTGTYATGNSETLAAADQWNNANSDPIGDVNDAHLVIKNGSLRMANTMILGFQVYHRLKVNAQILARMGNANLGVVTADVLKLLFDVKELLIGSAQKATSNPGQTVTTGYMWGKNAILAYIDPTIRTTKGMTLGYQPSTQGMITSRFRVDSKKSDKIEVSHTADEVIAANTAGYLIASAIA